MSTRQIDRVMYRGACGGARRLAAAACALMCSALGHAQTLDDQYAFYLQNTCLNLAFARDANGNLLPGQAGPRLSAYCNATITSGAGTTTSNGGAGAEEAGNLGGAADRALERRRERARKANGGDSAPSDPADTELASFGTTSVFLSLDYLHERQANTPYEAGRSSHGFGGLVGIDHRFGTMALLGFAMKYSEQDGTIVSGGNFTSRNPGAWVYASWLPVEGLFVDAAAGYDRKSIDTMHIVSLQFASLVPGGPPLITYNPPPTPVASSARENDGAGELRAGYDFSFAGLSIGPRAAVTFAHATLDPYVESGNTPMTLAFNEQTRTSLRTLVGFQATRPINGRSFVMVPQINADWVHEYRDDQRLLAAHFVEDLRPTPVELHFLSNAPDRDWAVLRVSTAAVFRGGMSAFAAIEWSAGNSLIERYQATLGVRWEL